MAPFVGAPDILIRDELVLVPLELGPVVIFFAPEELPDDPLLDEALLAEFEAVFVALDVLLEEALVITKV